MSKRYVVDTCALISFFKDVFLHAEGYEGSPALSNQVDRIMREGIYSGETDIRISIPAIVFTEIFEKWLYSQEFCRRFYYDVFQILCASENVEIRPTDREVLEQLLRIQGTLTNHDLNDRLVLASAMALAAPLITTDEAVTTYVNATRIIPSILR